MVKGKHAEVCAGDLVGLVAACGLSGCRGPESRDKSRVCECVFSPVLPVLSQQGRKAQREKSKEVMPSDSMKD